jgi:hypothetical protein
MPDRTGKPEAACLPVHIQPARDGIILTDCRRRKIVPYYKQTGEIEL